MRTERKACSDQMLASRNIFVVGLMIPSADPHLKQKHSHIKLVERLY